MDDGDREVPVERLAYLDGPLRERGQDHSFLRVGRGQEAPGRKSMEREDGGGRDFRAA
jgi:hypothetical protein